LCSVLQFGLSIVMILSNWFRKLNSTTESSLWTLLFYCFNFILQCAKIISDLNEYSDWSSRQIEDMCAAAINNNQVGWILSDEDVFDFFTKLLKSNNALDSFDKNVFAVQDELERIKKETNE
ncbi:MAG: hypothetical protein U0L17_03560, partial [Acutalibacteraceae bacterium]|nr:hypothetical protein [Acutalibacteraceae bacterium]